MPGILLPTRRQSYEQTYTELVLSTDPIAYWPLGERFGSTAYDVLGNEFNGAITGCTLGALGIGDGLTSMFFDAINDYIDIYSAGLDAAFDGNEGSVMIWLFPSEEMWPTVTNRLLVNLYEDNNNRCRIYTVAGTGYVRYHRTAWSGTSKIVTHQQDIDWCI